MKKFSLFLVLLFWFHANAFSQNIHMQNSVQNKINRERIAKKFNLPCILNEQKDEPSQIPKTYNAAKLFYTWDTIVKSDTLGLSQRETQTTDVAGKTLLRKTESRSGANWVNSSLDSIVYDANGNMTYDFLMLWSSGNWEKYNKFSFTYDALGDNLSIKEELWQAGGWVNSFQLIMTYDSVGNCLSEIDQVWAGGAWENQTKYTYTYSSLSKLILSDYAIWKSGAWLDKSRNSYTYDANGLRLTSLKEFWQGTQWVNSLRYTYSYDANENMILSFAETWAQSQWTNSMRTIYSYGSHLENLTSVSQWWSSFRQAWVNNYFSQLSYDADLNPTQELFQVCDTMANVWVNYYKARYAYNAYGNSVDGIYEVWDGANWSPGMGYLYLISQHNYLQLEVDIYQYHASYASHPGGIDESTSAIQLSVYPNPATDRLTVEYAGYRPGSEGLISVFSSSGTLVLQQSMQEQKQTIVVGTLPSGVYLLEFRSGRNHAVKTFVRK
ncbi:MAG: T9SS type A sorting domain-containing protein [Bacteroidota bacterium]